MSGAIDGTIVGKFLDYVSGFLLNHLSREQGNFMMYSNVLFGFVPLKWIVKQVSFDEFFKVVQVNVQGK
ncbi:hypothetical protein [Halalkalibacter wakoensis]|uniref:hypothetical protein n=1 Tax=Halalkalibacter wakoensis TaxID=127891 RepID=UPI0005577696|nr:hypothetical protein [Halalkalibacter wakoensis]